MPTTEPLDCSQILLPLILTLLFPPLGVFYIHGCSCELILSICLMPIPFLGHAYGFYIQYTYFKLRTDMDEHLQRIRRRRYAQRVMADVNRKAAADLAEMAEKARSSGGSASRRIRSSRERKRKDIPSVRIEGVVDGGGEGYPPSPMIQDVDDYED